MLDTSATGAASELLVSADLLRRGWHVYRAICAFSPSDLVILSGETLRTVQVKTAPLTAAGLPSIGHNRPPADPSHVGAYVAFRPDGGHVIGYEDLPGCPGSHTRKVRLVRLPGIDPPADRLLAALTPSPQLGDAVIRAAHLNRGVAVRTLAKLVAQGRVVRSGTGKRRHPFRFCKPS